MILTRAQLADSSRFRFWLEDSIRFSDIDLLGHANNNAIAVYFEEARVALFHTLDPQWFKGERVIVLAHSEFDYFAELHYPASIRTGTQLVKVGNSSFTLASGLFRGTELVAACEVICVQIDRKTRRSTPLSAELRAALLAYG